MEWREDIQIEGLIVPFRIDVVFDVVGLNFLVLDLQHYKWITGA